MGQTERDCILAILREKKIPFEQMVHEPVYTSEQAMRARKGKLHNGIKAMVLETERGMILALLAADLKLDMKALQKRFKFKKLQLAKKEKVLEKTGCEIGSVPPFGHAQQVATYIDESVFDHEWAEFNIGLTTESIKMKTSDLRKILPQKTIPFAQPHHS
ncbi:MAG: YbaK/EbsC family protein [Candidatus Diapherotrites archaeon]